jgi:chemotaxis signal transduction protein
MLRAKVGRCATQEARVWRLLAFSIGGRRFAAKIEELAGVSECQEAIPVASRTPFVSGVVRSGQLVLPTFDLAALLGISRRGNARLWLYAKHRLGTMAVCIDEELPILQMVERVEVKPYSGQDIPAIGSFMSGVVEIPILAFSQLSLA